ncbi:MAG TPA: hypothetical protein PLO33_03055 [Kouleothrix sp.]|uniref:hypothetical protein n=1 Tax=Kouleothrix sp. TaxID=2779161 RepID=UPI002BE00C24|nr:hypothetical protein [Kouleothrix sp.]HRC74627.1 hypothetical protein [Kouleothrix sp.]
MELLWLGYDGLSVRYGDVAAILQYNASLDARITRAYGRVPANVRAIVVTGEGAYLPSSWTVDQLRQRWLQWRGARS